MPFVPGVPDGYLFPVSRPSHLERAETALFEYLHPVVFYRDLDIGGPGPIPEDGFGIFFPHDNNVEGLGSPEVADGH